MAVQGIDVSSSNGAIYLQKVALSGITFAYIKASEGLNGDPNQPERTAYFRANWPRMRAAGLLCGAYHFFRANGEAAAQTRAFVQVVQTLLCDDLPPMLDVETSDGMDKATIILRAHQCLAAMQSAFGVKPIVYTYDSFWNQYLDGSFGAYPLWIASYGSSAPTSPTIPRRKPTLPLGWKSWTIWQYGSKGNVPGIPAEVDLDLYAGMQQSLTGFLRSARVKPPKLGQPPAGQVALKPPSLQAMPAQVIC